MDTDNGNNAIDRHLIFLNFKVILFIIFHLKFFFKSSIVEFGEIPNRFPLLILYLLSVIKTLSPHLVQFPSTYECPKGKISSSFVLLHLVHVYFLIPFCIS